MKVSELMTPNAHMVSPDESLRTAAKLMCEQDIGFLPVAENDRLVGTLTDRDIAVRAVAGGHSPTEPVREFMSREIKYCFADDDIDEVLENMGAQKLRRLPVLSADKRLVGILSLADAAQDHADDVGETLRGIARPGGAHSQTPTYAT